MKVKHTPLKFYIYYQSNSYSDKEPKKSWHDMIFRYATIRSNTQQVFNSWINAYEDLAPALGLYFSTKTGAFKYLEGRFLALAQGLETYHRRTSTETLMDIKPFETLVAEVMKGCPPEHVDWLNGRLMHGNEINLGKRLKRIIEPFKNHLGTSSVRSKLLRKIVDTRNYLTHYSENLKGDAARGKELWDICEKMEVIFNFHFLKVIGFSEEEIGKVIKESQPLIQKLRGVK